MSTCTECVCTYVTVYEKIRHMGLLYKSRSRVLVHQVKICQKLAFVMFMSKNFSFNYYHRLRRLGVSYQGEISLSLQPPRSTKPDSC